MVNPSSAVNSGGFDQENYIHFQFLFQLLHSDHCEREGVSPSEIQRLVCYLSDVGFGEFPVESVNGVLTE
jgi:hypothetical protein